MARAYHTRIAAFAADANEKWVDNLLSHAAISGVTGGTRGVSRRISTTGIKHIALVHRLNKVVGLSVDAAVVLAERLLGSAAEHAHLADALELHFDRRSFDREVDARLADAGESVLPPRRGRPKQR